MAANIDTDKMKSYAFAGIPTSSGCKIAELGGEYIKAANATNSDVFDICKPDWSDHFDLLTTFIISSITSSFDMNFPIVEIISITVGGVEIPNEKYSFEGRSVRVDPDVIVDGGLEVIVKYKPER